MSSVGLGSIVSSSDLYLYTIIGGVLVDQNEVGFQIWDISDGTPGTQIFPTIGGTWEEMTVNGKFATGSYFPYDSNTSRGWQVPIDANVGSHRIKWRYKYEVADSYLYSQEDFEVSEMPAPIKTYVNISDIRAAGIDASTISDDNEIFFAILLWQNVLDRCCRQWFLPKTLTVDFDGDNSMTMNLGVPCIEVEYLRINKSSTDLNSELYMVYGNQTDGLQSRRRNPKIALVQNIIQDINRDIHLAPFHESHLRFVKGYKNQSLRGTFGFVNDDLSPPRAIKRALTKLVIEKLTNPIYPGDDAPTPAAPSFAGIVVEEKTDGHSLKYGAPSLGKRKSGLSGITSDPEIQDIIKLYRGPIGIATPSHWMNT